MKSLADFSIEKLAETIVRDFSQPRYRAKQILAHVTRYDRYDEMTDIPKELRSALSERYADHALEIEKSFKSSDGTIKYLYHLLDDNVIEGAYMTQHYGNTLCVSTQVGCRMGCAFCASGIGGLVRNLTSGEILSQVLCVNRLVGGTPDRRAVTNIVLMGSGEPLDNYDEVAAFLRAVTDKNGLAVSARNISLSSCGIVENIRRLADDGFGVTLTISLHASTDEVRRTLMPIANKYTIHEIVSAARYYFEKTGRRVIFEYAMIKGTNIDRFDAKRLSEILRGFPTHVNLIPLNPVKEKKLSGCTPAESARFLERLTALGVSATIRTSRGGDVGGACGQLRRSHIKGDKK